MNEPTRPSTKSAPGGPVTNAPDLTLATLLTSVADETLVSLTIRKKGVQRGRGAAKQVYGDDLTHVLLWTGWAYENLVKLSRVRLKQLDKEGKTVRGLIRSARAEGYNDMTVEDAAVGVQEIRESLRMSCRTGNGGPDDPNNPAATLRGQWYKPLTIAGKGARGCKVYVGPDRRVDGDGTRYPTPGTVYVHGLKLGEAILTAAPNGHWTPTSSGKTIAKNHLRRRLPIGRYVSYALAPGAEYDLKMGQAAIEAASKDGLMISPSVLLALFKIAQATSQGL